MQGVAEMIEKEAVKMQMKEIVTASFSVPSLKESVLTSIEEHTKQSDFLFGRLAGVHYQMFSENMKETERIAASVELMMLAGDMLDDLMDQDSLETSWSKAPLTTSFHMAIGLLLAGQKQLRICLSMMKKTRTIYFMLYIWASRVTYMKKWMI